MSDMLLVYLHDHVAAAEHAASLLEALRDRHAGKPLGEFTGSLLVEVQADRAVLEQIAGRLGSEKSVVKELGGWLADKVSRLKLSRGRDGDFGTFEALEFLVLGIHGKAKLWQVLALLAPFDERLHGVEFADLIERAEAQHDATEAHRLEAARQSLLPPVH